MVIGQLRKCVIEASALGPAGSTSATASANVNRLEYTGRNPLGDPLPSECLLSIWDIKEHMAKMEVGGTKTWLFK